MAEPASTKRSRAAEESQGLDFARAVALAAGDLEAPPALTYLDRRVVALGSWMRANAVERAEIMGAMRALGRALVALAGFDAGREPVPMRSKDPILNLSIMASYLESLVARASAAQGGIGDGMAQARRRLLAEAVETIGA
ncbi:MAG: hypothetical protein ACRD0Z_07035 [Acidimicrobiales bacterium]